MKSVAFGISALTLMLSVVSAQEAGKTYAGVVKPYRASAVNAKTVANVALVAVEEGQRVARGDLLAQLDDVLAQAQYEIARLRAEDETAVTQARTRLEQAQRDMKRVTDMGQAAAAVDRERAKYGLDFAQAELQGKERELDLYKAAAKGQKAALDQYRVTAPFAGIVARQLIEVGESTAPVERQLFQIIDISKVYVRVHPDIARIRDIAAGDEVTVTSDVLPDVAFTGTVSFVSPSADLGGGTFEVKLLVDNSREMLRPEMQVRVAFAPAGERPKRGAAPEAGAETVR